MDINDLIYKKNIRKAYLFTIITLGAFCFNSIFSIFNSEFVYRSADTYNAFRTNDIINLILGVPALTAVMVLTKKNRLAGLLNWTGALLFVVYNQTAYLIASDQLYNYLMNLIILIPAVIAAVLLSASTDTKALYDIMKTGFPRRTFSIIVIVLGAAFISLAISKLVMHYSGIETASAADTAVNISDITSSLIWIITGFLVLFRNRFGFALITAVYFQSVLLFLGLIIFLLLKPILSNSIFSVGDFIAVAGMSLICIIPYAVIIKFIHQKRP